MKQWPETQIQQRTFQEFLTGANQRNLFAEKSKFPKESHSLKVLAVGVIPFTLSVKIRVDSTGTII
jgi:hypothetical protein